jgi:hypothetical protein
MLISIVLALSIDFRTRHNPGTFKLHLGSLKVPPKVPHQVVFPRDIPV